MSVPGVLDHPGPGTAGGVGDLAEVIAAFSQVSARLEATHETLRAEVERLRRELSEANEQLQRSRRLAALGEMAAGIAHEVRNPLGSIGLYARLLEQDLADRPEPRAVARKIVAAVRGLDGVVNDVLAFAREMRVRPEQAAAADLFTQAVEACCPAGPPTGVRIDRADLRRGGVPVDCDPALAHRALMNLIRNALQAMADRPGREHVLTLEAEVLDGGGAAALRVTDTGPGLAPGVIDRMFNPFFTTRHTGTGLGLAIVHRIMDAHGGRVEVRSAPGEGATFELHFPSRAMAGAARGAPEAPASPAADADRGRAAGAAPALGRADAGADSGSQRPRVAVKVGRRRPRAVKGKEVA